MTRGTVALAIGAVLWCAFVIVTTFLPGGPSWPPIAVHVPGFLVVPVVLHTLLRARSHALLCLAHVPQPVLLTGFAVAVGGWLVALGAVAGKPGTESLNAVAGLVIVLHVAFGLIAVGMARTGR
ncbi:hypothetical protein [Saccharothrix longispora]|uniref:hypothetical protein n=1 Tax=Saccharothrix longispora TaxID=33920 RepID=UPI0028FDC29B|nr:hypothetical protein [Saccharothrix longispora]MBY8850915.1 hypothetical protein [Saccharothrix sp. MB29]MDU0293569.1 hypothetical protein [Saccharothrix longispora]